MQRAKDTRTTWKDPQGTAFKIYNAHRQKWEDEWKAQAEQRAQRWKALNDDWKEDFENSMDRWREYQKKLENQHKQKTECNMHDCNQCR